ncbi:hypothetical protein JHK82_043799 [Glycine max]|nr:hypothetical protein JHK85_044344 [Glycine max]KAG5106829.1 hypothetical protein JHK82_043799 [Glycine max]
MGFFQVVNHGIPVTVLEDFKDGVQRFYEQDTEVKKELYTRDEMRPFVYNNNYDLYSSPALNWRDTFMCYLAHNPPKHEDLPLVCSFLTLLLQDHIGGLQVLYQNTRIDIPSEPGALLITNDRFNSVEHRVVANLIGLRIFVACFFSAS